MAETPIKPRRHWFLFSLRAMLLLVVVLGVALGWTMHIARQQCIAVAALEDMGCAVSYSEDESRTILERVRALLGERHPRNVSEVDGRGTQLTDGDLSHLRGMAWLESLNLIDTQITDEGLKHLRSLTRISRLYVARSQDSYVYAWQWQDASEPKTERMRVTDTGLRHLRGFVNLEILNLGGTRVTDSGLDNLLPMHDLERLCLENTLITDASLVHLQELSRLKTLVVRNTQVSEAGESRIKRALPALRVVH